MKIAPRQIESFLAAPPPQIQAILVYGPEDGLMKERIGILARTVVDDPNDPFGVSVLDGGLVAEDPARLMDEALAIPMFGGRRLVRIENASDKVTPALKGYLARAAPQSMVLIEGADLKPRSSLRALCERAENAAALPCYAEDARDMGRVVARELADRGYRIAPDALQFLGQALAGDRRRMRGEIEKLALYAGAPGAMLSLDDVRECCGDSGAQGFDDLAYGVGGRNAAQALGAFARLASEGTPVVAMLRVLQNHFRRLHLARAQVDSGKPMEAVLKTLQPPVFFKQVDAFRAQMERWPLESMERALAHLAGLEARTKQTGAPDQVLFAQTILELCGKLRIR
ncbi:MAG: DNA polymerase III subunit delta [Rhodospirillales bacterium]|nr:DNA polymerase III subunit delta [Rhodospirillales bacterium]